MNSGGIFNGPTALGYLGFGATGGTGMDCGSTPAAAESLVLAVKAELRRRGYTKLSTDAVWDGCTQSAFIKETGAPLWHTDQVKQFLGKTCTAGYMSYPGSPGGGALLMPPAVVDAVCTTGADSKTGGGAAPPTGWTVPGTPWTLPGVPATPPGGTSDVVVQQCPQGQIFDVNLRMCVPTLDPFGCGAKCNSFPILSADWTKCIAACNATGGASTKLPPVVPGTTAPPVPPGTQAPPVVGDKMGGEEESVFGKYWPYIVGAMVVGLGAAVYFGTKKKPATLGPRPGLTPARPNRRRRRRAHRRGRR